MILSACSKVGVQTGQAQSHTIPGTLRYGDIEDPVGLNPLLRLQAVGTDLDMFIFGFFFNVDDKLNYVPELATEVPTLKNGGISKDGLTITYHLRRGVKWHDRQPFTSRDVVFTTNAILNPKNNLQSRNGWDQIKSIEAVGPYEVRFHLNKIYAPAIATFFCETGEYPVLPAHLLEQYPDINHVPFNSNPVGTGPFKFVKWVHGDRIELVANDQYWRGRPKLQRIIFKIIPKDTTIVVQLKTHEIDAWFRAPANQYTEVKKLEPDYRDYEPIHPEPGWKSLARKLWAPLAALGALLVKFKFLIFAVAKFKLFTVAASLIVSVGAYALLGGWWFGLGLVGLIFVHEIGHVLELRRQGVPASAPLFIPFLGAFVGLKQMPKNAWKEAQVALAGRMMLKRVMGKASFATVKDGSGLIQFFITPADVGEQTYDAFKKWDLGDIVAARGEQLGPARAELGVWVIPQERGKGLARAALRLAAGWLFERCRLARLELLTEPDNEPLLRAAATAGFVREGVLRHHARRGKGRQDMVVLSLLASDLGAPRPDIALRSVTPPRD